MIKSILIIMMILSIFNLIAISDTRQIVYAEIDVDEQTQLEDAYCDDAEDESRQKDCEKMSKGELKEHEKIKILAEEMGESEPFITDGPLHFEPLNEEEQEELEEQDWHDEYKKGSKINLNDEELKVLIDEKEEELEEEDEKENKELDKV